MKEIHYDGMSFGRDEVMSLREEIIKYRNEALSTNDFEKVIILSHTTALLFHLANAIREE